ncbi:MAG: hypothetical protein KF819_08685 [Labilithrix sp.]|nr:hypothetical protein [Labilithrix sp.]
MRFRLTLAGATVGLFVGIACSGPPLPEAARSSGAAPDGAETFTASEPMAEPDAGPTGTCGEIVCAPSERCIEDRCIEACPAGTVICERKCVEPNASLEHCGATPGCGVTGGTAGARCTGGSICIGGQCLGDCSDGTVACASAGGDVCVDLRSDDANCGGCGHRCTGGKSCSFGLCCASGETACMGTCVDTSSNPSACGGCGVTCAQDETCVAGACTP